MQAIAAALLTRHEEMRLEPSHFVEVYRQRSGAPDGLNPFVAECFERIDVRKLLGRER